MGDSGLGRYRGRCWEMGFSDRKDTGMLVHALSTVTLTPLGLSKKDLVLGLSKPFLMVYEGRG